MEAKLGLVVNQLRCVTDGVDEQMVGAGGVDMAAVVLGSGVCVWKLVAGDQDLVRLQSEANQPLGGGEGHRRLRRPSGGPSVRLAAYLGPPLGGLVAELRRVRVAMADCRQTSFAAALRPGMTFLPLRLCHWVVFLLLQVRWMPAVRNSLCKGRESVVAGPSI